MREALKKITAILAVLSLQQYAIYIKKVASFVGFGERFTDVRDAPTLDRSPGVFFTDDPIERPNDDDEPRRRAAAPTGFTLDLLPED